MNPPAEIERLAAAAAATAGRNPAIVLDAFCPPEGLPALSTLDLLRLERIGSPLITGGNPGVRDLLLAHAVISRWADVEKAHRKGRIDAFLEELHAHTPAADVPRIAAAVTDALRAAFAPVPQDAGGDPAEKKTQGSDGGSASSAGSAPTTAGPLP